jgi:hypothetical protein
MSTSTSIGPSLNPGLLAKIGLLFGVLAVAVFFGLVAVTASPIFVGLAAGLLIGAALLGKPIWNMWLILSLGLLVNGILPLFFDAVASKAAWGISLLGFILLISVFFTLVTKREVTKNTPAFIWVALAFMLLIVTTSLAQWHGLGEFLGGIKRYFQVWGLMFAVAWLRVDQPMIRRFLRFMLVIAIIQFPFALYELIKLVPLREALVDAYPGMVPIDVVAGTFGASLHGGGSSGQMAAFLIIIFAFLLARWNGKALTFGKLAFMSICVLIPLFMGETKNVVVLLPLMFLVLYRFEVIRRPHYALFGLVVLTLITVLAGYVYLTIDKVDLHDLIYDTLRYNVYEHGYGGYALNRTTVFPFWLKEQGLQHPVSFVFGNGIGSVQSPFGSLTPGHIALLYPLYGLGLNAGSTLLWDTGVFGSGLFLMILGLAWRSANQLRRDSVSRTVRADALAIQAAIVLFAFELIYSESILDSLNFQIVFTMLLGYLAWLHRQRVNQSAQST